MKRLEDNNLRTDAKLQARLGVKPTKDGGFIDAATDTRSQSIYQSEVYKKTDPFAKTSLRDSADYGLSGGGSMEVPSTDERVYASSVSPVDHLTQ
jgi:hypothetical protein